jgi:hypothetical protein
MDELNEATSLLNVQEAYDYKYAPLQHPDSIRLLVLMPGEMDSPIQTYLAEHRLQENPPYEAVSYTWANEEGDCSLSSQIRCDDARLWVTKNCELALRYLRETDSELTLWVDAICINQKDVDERGHQVGIMRDVYSKAVQVLIWLGEESKDRGAALSHPGDSISSSSSEIASGPPSSADSSCREISGHEERRDDYGETISVSEIFLDYLEKMGADVDKILNIGQDPSSSSLYQELISQIYEGRRANASGPGSELWRGFTDIVNRRWWTRVWVVQEVVAAKSAFLICSKKCTNYHYFLHWYRLVKEDHSQKATGVWNSFGLAHHHLIAVHSALEANESSEQLEAFFQVAQGARNLIASNPRDNVFGVLGLSDKFKTLVPSPDYNKPTIEIFTDVAKAFLTLTKSLSVLEHATSNTPVIGHPSWVPYWPNHPVIRFPLFTPYCVSKTSKAIFTISSDSRELRAKGKIFDRVEEIQLADLGAYSRASSLWKRNEGYRRSCDTGFSLTKYPTEESVEEALGRSLCWDTDYESSYPAPDELVDSFREWYRVLTSFNTSKAIEEELNSQENSFLNILNKSSPLCVTASGYLAAVPCTIEVGDCIAILAGGRLPFVLRPTGDHYCLIGPCYVHGIMNGEAFPENLEESQWFSIR